jgi:hypothetical protein
LWILYNYPRHYSLLCERFNYWIRSQFCFLYLWWSYISFLILCSWNSGLESRGYGHRDPSRWPRGSLSPQKLVLTSPTSGDRSFDIARSWTQATEFFSQQETYSSPITARTTTMTATTNYSYYHDSEIKLLLPMVSQPIHLRVRHPFQAHDQILLVPFIYRKIALLFVLGRPLWREDRSVTCSAIGQWSESRRTRNHTLLSHLRLLGSLSVASYDSQGGVYLNRI